MAGGMKALQKQLLQMQIDQLKKANAPNPYLEQLLGLNKSIVNWHTNPDNTVKDIYKHPTLGGKLPVFQMAMQQRDAGRMGRGIAGLGDKMNPQYAKELGIEDSTNRNIYASGMIEQGLQNELGNAQQNIQSLVLGDTQRTTASNPLFGSAAKLAQDIGNSGWGSFFKGILSGVLQGAAGIGMGFLTGGLSSIGGAASTMAGGHGAAGFGGYGGEGTYHP